MAEFKLKEIVRHEGLRYLLESKDIMSEPVWDESDSDRMAHLKTKYEVNILDEEDRRVGKRKVGTYSGGHRVRFGAVYDGKEDVPAVVVREPWAFLPELGNWAYIGKSDRPDFYRRIVGFNLKTGKSRVLCDKKNKQHTGGGAELEYIVRDGKGLIQFIIPASSVLSFSKGREADALLQVYCPEDLERVKELNERQYAKSRARAGTQRCSAYTSTLFEVSETHGYPAYQVAVDLRGDVHSASRIEKLGGYLS